VSGAADAWTAGRTTGHRLRGGAGRATLLAESGGCRTAAPAASGPRASGAAPAAEIFAPGVISDAQEQWRITFTPDGRTAYFASSPEFFPFTRRATIYVSRRARGGWTTPEVAAFSGRYGDIDPFLAPDGRRLYFSSIRPVDGATRGDADIWYVERTPPAGARRSASGPR
jgi:hypothetical protein